MYCTIGEQGLSLYFCYKVLIQSKCVVAFMYKINNRSLFLSSHVVD